jgi:phosphocarrier protein FPr
MAKELGLPMVVGLGDAVLAIPPGTELGIDGTAGRLWIRPEAQRRRSLRAPVAAADTGEEEAGPPAACSSADGQAVRVDANIVDEGSARRAVAQGAEGVGLLRTEVLFQPLTTAPDEEEQVRILERIAARLGNRPLTVRSLDVGGDKSLPFLETDAEDNPFLGLRGIRLSLARPDLFSTQLRAILRLSAGHPVRLMLPMVSTAAEIRRTRELLEEARCDLRRRNLRCDADLPLGVMIEVPAAALTADRLAAEADFFSIGTNDLSQYVMAADRNNTAVAGLADPFEPAVLRLIHSTAAAARAAGIPVGVCGRMASDPLAVPLLLGLGIEELSVAVGAIADVRRAVAGVVMAEAAAVAEGLLAMQDAESVRKALARRVAGTAR